MFADCLSSQWTEAVTLRAWLQQVVYAPMAPDVTSFLQEPDTHEHSQLKATIRQVKGEIHWALEQDWLQKVKADPETRYQYPSVWGPYECLYCVSEASGASARSTRKQCRCKGFKRTRCLWSARTRKASSSR